MEEGTWVSIDSSGEDASLISSTHSSDGNYDMLESQSQTPGKDEALTPKEQVNYEQILSKLRKHEFQHEFEQTIISKFQTTQTNEEYQEENVQEEIKEETEIKIPNETQEIQKDTNEIEESQQENEVKFKTGLKDEAPISQIEQENDKLNQSKSINKQNKFQKDGSQSEELGPETQANEKKFQIESSPINESNIQNDQFEKRNLDESLTLDIIQAYEILDSQLTEEKEEKEEKKQEKKEENLTESRSSVASNFIHEDKLLPPPKLPKPNNVSLENIVTEDILKGDENSKYLLEFSKSKGVTSRHKKNKAPSLSHVSAFSVNEEDKDSEEVIEFRFNRKKFSLSFILSALVATHIFAFGLGYICGQQRLHF